MPQVAHQFGRNCLEIRHAIGAKADMTAMKQAYEACGQEVVIEPYIYDMVAAYQWADCVITRAGALALSELMVMGKAAIAIPFAQSTDQHQVCNAQYYATQQALWILNENQCQSPTAMVALITLLREDPAIKHRLEEAAWQQGKVDATTQIVDNICGKNKYSRKLCNQ